MTARARRLSCVLLTLLGSLTACDPGDGTVTLPPADVEGYGREVHAYIEARCGTLDCHGDPGRPARVYAETGLRMTDELRDTPITDAELQATASALVAVDPFPSAVDRHILLLKPLDRDAGGMKHEGEDIWSSRDDPAYICLRAWLAGDVASASTQCAAAREAVALPPP